MVGKVRTSVPWGRMAQGCHGLLRHVQPGAALVDDLHGLATSSQKEVGGGGSSLEFPRCVLPPGPPPFPGGTSGPGVELPPDGASLPRRSVRNSWSRGLSLVPAPARKGLLRIPPLRGREELCGRSPTEIAITNPGGAGAIA